MNTNFTDQNNDTDAVLICKKMSAESGISGTESPTLPDESKCPICLEAFVLPVRLPSCEHKFCFLCIKGVALRTGKCAMCRSQISQTILTQPEALLDLEFPSNLSPVKPKYPQQSFSKSGKSTHSYGRCGFDQGRSNSVSGIEESAKWYYSGYRGETLFNYGEIATFKAHSSG